MTTSTVSDSQPFRGHRHLRRPAFRVLGPTRRGGLGAVFVALDAELQPRGGAQADPRRARRRPVSRPRFLLEAEITGGLEHPGIVPVYGLGTDADGRPLLRDAVHQGETLKDAIDSFHGDESLKNDPGRRSLELRKLLRRFIDVCNAIDYAHSRGVLHRDLKPANIILGKHGETLVVDWGLAKAIGRADPARRRADARAQLGQRVSSETLPGSALGTPAYMSPEQAAGDLDGWARASDVYSLGATLYCLLTGRPPFEGDDVGAILRAVQAGRFPAAAAARPDDRPGARGGLPEGDGHSSRRTATPRRGARRRHRALDGRRAGDRLARALDAPSAAMGAAEPDGRHGRGGGAVLVALAGTGAVLAVQTQANHRAQGAN